MSKDLVKNDGGALVAVDYGNDYDVGFEDADSSCFAIPYLRVLQATSPQAKKKDPEYVQGAEEGDLFNTVSGKLYKDGVDVIPVYFVRKYNEWVVERSGNGFRGSHTAAEYMNLDREMIVNDKGQSIEINRNTGNMLTDTREHYVLIINEDGTTEPALLSITSTQIKKSKKWMTNMQNIRVNGQRAPMPSQVYRITTVGESNDKGSWAGLKIDHVGPVTNQLMYNEAIVFRDLIRAGAVTVAETDDSEDF